MTNQLRCLTSDDLKQVVSITMTVLQLSCSLLLKLQCRAHSSMCVPSTLLTTCYKFDRVGRYGREMVPTAELVPWKNSKSVLMYARHRSV